MSGYGLLELFFLFSSPPREERRGWEIYRARRRLSISWTPRPGTVAGRGAEVVVAGGLLVVVGFGVGVLGAMAGRVELFFGGKAASGWLLYF